MKSMVTLVAQQGNDPFLLIVSLRLIVSLWSNYCVLSRCRLIVLLEGLWSSKAHEWWRKLIGWSLVICGCLILYFHFPPQGSSASSHLCQSHLAHLSFSLPKCSVYIFPSHLYFIRIMKIIDLSLWLTFPSKISVFATLVAGDIKPSQR